MRSLASAPLLALLAACTAAPPAPSPAPELPADLAVVGARLVYEAPAR